MNQQLSGAPSSATASVTSPITSPSQWGALFLLSYYTDVAGVGAAAAGHHAVTGAGIRCLRRRLCRTSGGQCEYPLGENSARFLLFGTAPLMIFSVLVFWVPTDWSHSSKVVYAYLTYMGLGLCYSLGEYSLWFTCYRDDPTTTIPRPSGRGSRDCRFINLCLHWHF